MTSPTRTEIVFIDAHVGAQFPYRIKNNPFRINRQRARTALFQQNQPTSFC